jgi:hypothetical protein
VTWRDTKTALIVFNRNQATTPVVDAIKAAVETHTAYKRGAMLESATRLRAVFGARSDAARDVIVTVIIVPIPTAT